NKDMDVFTELPAQKHQDILENISKFVSMMQNTLFPTTFLRTWTYTEKQRNKAHKDMKTCNIHIGSFVMLKRATKGPKLEPINDGPYKVVNITKGGTFILQDLEGKLLPNNYPANRLITLSTTVEPEDDVYEVEAIIDHKDEEDGSFSYLVRWKGFGPDHDTWEPQSNFIQTDVIRKYWSRRGN
ncbi:hypothetical protein GGI12_005080, partial [Dipsacomyces acuminosporus]